MKPICICIGIYNGNLVVNHLTYTYLYVFSSSKAMAEEKSLVTQEGYDKLVAEKDYLIHTVRPEIINELQEARAQGDLSENADYDAARDRQARNNARIEELEAMIKNAVIIKDTDSDGLTVKFGYIVTLLDLSDQSQMEFQIVGTQEADPLNGKLSNATPVGESILGAKVGDVVTISHVEEPYDVKILGVRKPEENK